MSDVQEEPVCEPHRQLRTSGEHETVGVQISTDVHPEVPVAAKKDRRTYQREYARRKSGFKPRQFPSDETKTKIRVMLAEGETQDTIALICGVSQPYVSKIKRGVAVR